MELRPAGIHPDAHAPGAVRPADAVAEQSQIRQPADVGRLSADVNLIVAVGFGYLPKQPFRLLWPWELELRWR